MLAKNQNFKKKIKILRKNQQFRKDQNFKKKSKLKKSKL